MSTTYLHRSFCFEPVKAQPHPYGNLLNKEIKSTIKRLRKMSPKEIFLIQWRDCTVNVLPFLFNMLTFCGVEIGYLTILVQRCRKYNYDVNKTVYSHFGKDELVDLNFLESLLPTVGYQSGIRELAVHAYVENPNEFAASVFDSLFYLIEGTLEDKGYLGTIIFDDKSICNTQAASLYMSIYWLFKMSPYSRQLLGRSISKLDLESRLESFIPEGSLHYRYLKGEMSGSEVLHNYKSVKIDGTEDTVFEREIVSLATHGKYDGRPLTEYEREVADWFKDYIFKDRELDLSFSLALSCYDCEASDRFKSKVDELTLQVDKANSEKNKQALKVHGLKDEISSLRGKISDLEKENSKLARLLSNHETYDSLQTKIKELKSDLCEKSAEVEQIFEENIELKKLISSQKKEIKSLTASVDALKELAEDSSEPFEEEETFDIEEAVSVLKDKRIVFVGMEFNSSLVNRFKAVGLDSVSWVDRNTKSLGCCDLAVVFTQRCKHSDVRRIESLAKNGTTKMIYFSGSNFEQLLALMYDEVIA